MTVKQHINHGAIHLHNGIFHFIDLSIDFSFSISLLFTKNNELWNERKEDVLQVLLLQRITYQRR